MKACATVFDCIRSPTIAAASLPRTQRFGTACRAIREKMAYTRSCLSSTAVHEAAPTSANACSTTQSPVPDAISSLTGNRDATVLLSEPALLPLAALPLLPPPPSLFTGPPKMRPQRRRPFFLEMALVTRPCTFMASLASPSLTACGHACNSCISLIQQLLPSAAACDSTTCHARRMHRHACVCASRALSPVAAPTSAAEHQSPPRPPVLTFSFVATTVALGTCACLQPG
mmetsp:Transcript_72170/g.143158  ORF Transcript_72170/g.143158 Transcript_72170/m.143158 type:complete len:230 (-) Transcript_72170:894-1583(-)